MVEAWLLEGRDEAGRAEFHARLHEPLGGDGGVLRLLGVL